MLNQQRTLAASFYLDGLDFFGGVPLYTTTQSEVKGRSTDVETFNFIDSLLKIAVPNLPIKEELGGMETGSIHRAAGAALQARLYFNAKSYIGKEMFTEAPRSARTLSTVSTDSMHWKRIGRTYSDLTTNVVPN